LGKNLCYSFPPQRRRDSSLFTIYPCRRVLGFYLDDSTRATIELELLGAFATSAKYNKSKLYPDDEYEPYLLLDLDDSTRTTIELEWLGATAASE
jgi:hypothetical protein